MLILALTQGKSTYVDSDVGDHILKYKWCFNKKGSKSQGYAQRSKRIRIEKGVYKMQTIYLHREIMGNPDGEIDHVNGDTLDNRRCNLRVVTRQQNMLNRSSVPDSTSRYTGVHLHKLTGKWRAQITVKGKTKSLGLFHTQEAAYQARLKFVETNSLYVRGR